MAKAPSLLEGPDFRGEAAVAWEGPEEKVLREVVRLAELHLSSQLTLVSAAGQRASSLAGIFGTASTALLGVTLVAIGAQRGFGVPLMAAGLAAAVTMFTGCVLCALSASSGKWMPPGTDPNTWGDDVLKGPFEEALQGQALNYQDWIVFNRRALRRTALLLRWGIYVGASTPAVAIAVWVGLTAAAV